MRIKFFQEVLKNFSKKGFFGTILPIKIFQPVKPTLLRTGLNTFIISSFFITSCFFAYLGYESIASTGEEAIDPKTNIPNAIIISLFFVCFVYMTLSSVITLNFPYFVMDPKTPFASVLSWNGMGVINTWVRIGTLCAITNALLGVLFPSTRIVYNMADDGLVYRWIGKVNGRTKVPIAATVICTLIGGVLCMFFNPSSLLDFSTMGTLAAFAMSANCVIILRYTPSKKQLCLGKFFGENNQKIQRLKDQEDSIRKYAYTLSTIYLFGFLGIDKVPMIKDIDESLDVFVFGLSIYF